MNANMLFKKHKFAMILISYAMISFVAVSFLVDSKWAWTEYVSPLLYPLVSINQWHAHGLTQLEIIIRQAIFNTLGVFLDIGVVLIILSIIATGAWLAELVRSVVEGTRVDTWRVSMRRFWQEFKSVDLAVQIFSRWQKRNRRVSLKNKLISRVGGLKNPTSRNIFIFIFASLPGSLLPFISATIITVGVAELKHLRWREWAPWLIAGGINRAILDGLISRWLYLQLADSWQIFQQLINKLMILLEILF